jgi:hypothetical protein
MTIEHQLRQRLRITLIALGASILAALGSGAFILWKAVRVERAPKAAPAHIESPITASGGSLTFRAHGGWLACQPTNVGGMSYYCVKRVNVSNFYGADFQDTDLTASASSGTVTFFFRQAGGAESTSGAHIILCTSSLSAPDRTCGGTNYVQVQVYGANSSLVQSNAADNDYTAYQYRDSTCQVNTVIPVPACEHPGKVTWVDGTNYTCRQGACRVSLE